MPQPRILAIVLAGGEGSRLNPLTADRSKPAVPFAGRYRIVDFVLSNMMNSGIHMVYLLVQYKSQSLIEHINHSWSFSHVIPDQFVTVVPPQMREGPEWFQGTADAVFQNRNLILQHRPTLVAVFGADHIYRMNIRDMVRFHQERHAQLSVAALPVPLAGADRFGIITADAGGRILDFLEKPPQPTSIPGRPDQAFASMGNYIFDTDVLLDALNEAGRAGEHDFGRHILPRLIGDGHVYAYDFSSNHIPGIRNYEEPAYWRDVGTIDAFYEANMDTMGAEPRFNLFNPLWLIHSSNYQGPVPRIFAGQVNDVCIGAGSVIKGGSISHSIIRREVLIEPDVVIEDSIVMDYVTIRRGARLRRVIVDRYNEIAGGDCIGLDAACDRKRFHVTDSGITVIPKGVHYCGAFHYH